MSPGRVDCGMWDYLVMVCVKNSKLLGRGHGEFDCLVKWSADSTD